MADTGSTPHDDAHTPGMPPGITAEGAEMRSRIAASLTRDAFPAKATELVQQARSDGAEPEVVTVLQRLPDGVTFKSVAEVAVALGLGHEERP